MNTTIPFQSQQPIFGKVGNISELVNMTAEDRTRYSISLDTYRTNLSVMQNERAEGRAEGRVEERLANARALKANGVSLNIIAMSLGLSEEELSLL